MRLLALLLISLSCLAGVNLTNVAAGTTIAVNLLDIRENIQRIRKGVKAVKKAEQAIGKTVKKVKPKK
jgi:hypothetical protein